MPKLTPFEAPMTGYNIPDRGATAYEHLAATQREAGQQMSSLLHQEGKSLEEGMRNIGRGLGDMQKDASMEEKANKHDELQDAIATNNEATALHLNLLKSFNDAKNKAYDDPNEKGDWLKRWTEEQFNPAVEQFQTNAVASKSEADGRSRLSYVKAWQSHFLFTAGPAAELERSTSALTSSYNKTKSDSLSTIRGGGDIKPDGTPATLLQAWKMNDTALQNVLRPGFNGDYKKLAEAHTNEQHDLTLASAEELIKSATTPEETAAALKEVLDPKQIWKANDRYGLRGDADTKHLEKVADEHVTKLKGVKTAALTQAEHEAKQALYTTGNKLVKKALEGTLKSDDLQELFEVQKKHEAFIKPKDVTDLIKDITDHQNHPDKVVTMDRQTVQKYYDLAAKGQLPGNQIMAAKARGEIDKETATELYDMNEKSSKLGPGLAKMRDEFFQRYTRIIDGGYSTIGGIETASALGQSQIFKAKREAMRLEQEAVDKGQDPHTIYDAPPGKAMPAWLEKYRVNAKQAQDFDRAMNAPASTKPVILAPGQSPSTLKSGTKFVIPDGPSKGMIGTVP